MSIYKPAFERVVSENDVTHTVRPSAAPKGISSPAPQAAPELVRLRKTQPVNHLLPITMRWLRGLPQDIRPTALIQRYPRIANLVALDWKKPAACRRYLNELLFDHRRGNRQGFPLDVHRELEALQDYLDRQGPSG